MVGGAAPGQEGLLGAFLAHTGLGPGPSPHGDPPPLEVWPRGVVYIHLSAQRHPSAHKHSHT